MIKGGFSFSVYVFFKKNKNIFRAVLDSQQNWAGSTPFPLHSTLSLPPKPPPYQYPGPQGTFTSIDEPTLTHHHPKFTVYIWVHSWYGTVYEFWQMCNDI